MDKTPALKTDRSVCVKTVSGPRKMLSGPVDGATVRIVEGLRCPCGRQLQPYDLRFDRDRAVLICGQCHADALAIEP